MPPSRSPLDLDADTMRRLGARVADRVVQHLETLRDQPVLATMSRDEASRRLAGPAPARGRDFEALLATLERDVLPFAAREPHPGFMAYVPSCPAFPAVMGDWMASGFNFFGGVWAVSAGPTELELVVLDWFREWLGMPTGAGGLLTNGGSGATLTAIIAARHHAVGDDAARLARLTVYMSDQTHSSAIRAAWIAGIPRANVRLLDTDHAFRIVPTELEDAIAADRSAGLIPLAVVASAGTTNTGAVDPLPALADLCERERIWLHVDAAYGGFAALTPRGRDALAGIERADSVTMDPHKWLFVPFECGCLLLRDPRRLERAFRIYPEYLKDVETSGTEVNFADYGEQLTRRSRALAVWMNVSFFGTDALRDAVSHGIGLAEYAEGLVRTTPELEVLSPATLAVLCFRVHPHGLDDPEALDALNDRVLRAVVASGRFFISTTRIRGALALRICPIGYRTTQDDVDSLMAAIRAVPPLNPES